MKMISNNLLRLILKNISRKLEIPEKTLALAYGFNDEVEAAKILVEFAVQTETLEILGGWIDGSFFDVSQIKTLATLPDKVTLQAQIVGRLSGIICGLAYAFNYPIQKLAYVVETVRTANPRPVEEVKLEKVKAEAIESTEEVAAESTEVTKTTAEEPSQGSNQSPAEPTEVAESREVKEVSK